MSHRSLSKIPKNKTKLVKKELYKLAFKLREARLGAAYTQEALAEALDISPRTMSAIETGDRIPSLPMLLCFLDELGLCIKIEKK